MKQKVKDKEEVDRELKSSDTKKDDTTRTHAEILKQQIEEACKTYDRNTPSILVSSFTAGLELSFSFLLIATVLHFFTGHFSEESIFKFTALVYPIGFILVVLGQSILFTEQTSLLTLPVLNKERSLMNLFRVWGIVIFGNLAGGMLMSATYIWIGPKLGLFNMDDLEKIALHMTEYSAITIFVSAILAGWLMGLLSWLVTSSRESIGEILIIFLITAIMGFTSLHHSIIGNIEVFTGFLISDQISFWKYIKTIGLALTGNAVGAVVFVALLKYRAFVFNVNRH
ncbi:formate/nitrite transporter family protein [Gramella sp. GC03-9]|uniref:Formate/nitrite transporter family protein n=1 Tax=Christiangramia oceanisediminis TaxID=2920386 RepID=A0A9X2R8K5_9FLAO|nr:formate/nitrite transporter family protein [Gramella oceanisediminis]MCP9200407.1 formate/nitrite transporter family protein [Gramella oceanisediminis]